MLIFLLDIVLMWIVVLLVVVIYTVVERKVIAGSHSWRCKNVDFILCSKFVTLMYALPPVKPQSQPPSNFDFGASNVQSTVGNVVVNVAQNPVSAGLTVRGVTAIALVTLRIGIYCIAKVGGWLFSDPQGEEGQPAQVAQQVVINPNECREGETLREYGFRMDQSRRDRDYQKFVDDESDFSASDSGSESDSDD